MTMAGSSVFACNGVLLVAKFGLIDLICGHSTVTTRDSTCTMAKHSHKLHNNQPEHPSALEAAIVLLSVLSPTNCDLQPAG